MDVQSQNKWNKIYSDAEVGRGEPVWVLREYANLLPESGRGLDFACGLAANGVFLAQRGLQVEAWDISDVVVEKINAFANQANTKLTAKAHDLTSPPLASEQYDVIVVAHYLDRSIAAQIVKALRPGGMLFYQTFVKDVTPDYTGPGNPEFRLDPNELLRLFSPLRLVVYREDATIGDLGQGLRNVAAFVGRKQ